MNIKISKNEIRFRITKDELSELIDNECLLMESPLQSSIQKYLIFVEDIETPLQLKESDKQIVLFVDAETLSKFQKQLPSRDGIEGEFISKNGNAVSLSLEVDVRRKS